MMVVAKWSLFSNTGKFHYSLLTIPVQETPKSKHFGIHINFLYSYLLRPETVPSRTPHLEEGSLDRPLGAPRIQMQACSGMVDCCNVHVHMFCTAPIKGLRETTQLAAHGPIHPQQLKTHRSGMHMRPDTVALPTAGPDTHHHLSHGMAAVSKQAGGPKT